MNKIIIILTLLIQSYATFAAENDLDKQRLLAAIPEIADNSVQTKSVVPAMKCLVDTPAWDNWGYGHCFSVGWARSTTAYFTIDNVPSNFTIIWSNSSCNSQSRSCELTIFQYQSKTLSATVLDNSNNTFTTTTATAHYEGFN